MLCCVIHDIQDTSEQSLDSLVKHLRGFNIKAIPGEDVTEAFLKWWTGGVQVHIMIIPHVHFAKDCTYG